MTAADELTPRQRWGAACLLVAALVATFLLAAAVGAREAARGQRVLPFLDPLVNWIRHVGEPSIHWLLAHAAAIGWLTTGAALAVGLAGLIVARRRALPLLPLAAAVSLATWGEVLLLENRVALGTSLYGGAVVCALALGIRRPLARLGGLVDLPSLEGRDRSVGARRGRVRLWEHLLVYLLTVVALGTRLYALTELPQFFDLETIGFMLAGRTPAGVRNYLAYWLRANNNGVLHIFTQGVFFRLFGTSDYSVRLAAVFWGVAAVPLMYWLVRRLAGVGPAVVACVLLITAPEQLFWSRTENNFFIDITILALVSAHLGVWMIERLSAPAVLAGALWMPFTRYFYTPGMAMFLYPVALYAHMAAFARGAWRKAWYVVPLLAGGVVLWVLSFSILYSYLDNWHWRFVDPTTVYGAPVWRKQGQFNNTSLPELVRLQAISMAGNLKTVLESFTYRSGFSHWYSRMDFAPGHATVLNVGVVVMAVLGLGYFLGQCADRRIFLLLAWAALGLAPGLLSDEPAARRLALLFPALYAIIGILLGAAVRLVRACAGRMLAWTSTVLLSVAVAAVAWGSLVSHLLLPIGRTWLDGPSRFAAPIFADSDVIFHDLDVKVMMGLLLDSLDHFVQPNVTLGIEAVGPRQWLGVALDPRCSFTDQVYACTTSPQRLAAMQAHYHPQRITFMLQDVPSSERPMQLLRQLYPHGQWREYKPPGANLQLAVLTVRIGDVTALRSPSLQVAAPAPVAAGLAGRLLAGVRLTPTNPPVAGGPAEVVVRGGVRLAHDGWYRFALQPACSAAALSIDHQPNRPAIAAPMTAGIHAFELVLSDPTACSLPLRLLMQADGQRAMAAIPPTRFTAAGVVGLPAAQAPPLAAFSGYGAVTAVGQLPGVPVDIGADAQGRVSVLARASDGMRVVRLNPQGRAQTAWRPQLGPGQTLTEIHVAPDGTTVLTGDHAALLYDGGGRKIGAWDVQWPWTADIAFWHDGRILAPRQYQNAIGVYDRSGRLLSEWREFSGGPGRFQGPVTVTVNAADQLLVIEDDGQALLFQGSAHQWPPAFVRAFPIAFRGLPVQPRGCAFDGPQRLLVPDPFGTAPLLYDLEGRRLLAAEPGRDLSGKPLGTVLRVATAADRLYVLDSANRLWSVAH